MGTVVLSGAVVLVVLGFGNPLYWLAAAGVLFLYVRYGLHSSAPTAPGPAPTAGAAPTSYKAYRDRRDKQAKWERRYRRERPLESRRQERERA
ncbi:MULTISPECIES: hypothetical protein [Streptomyces]|uniref:Integral membrane protein n=1 Tax=Streptomyces asoensis TaxID=249586 RepID=A0ABQ3RRQ8_9ACTN|nr:MULTISPECIES: hypothetical protein [Streptomyces]MBK3630713.1 hypothetical protein [Streptomyces sp. MBT49]MBK3633066.1 hypothetical protein [Streptomyces sp. MBT97]GGQ44679.1 hypothetical protein GCM10010496_02830 [Streptomyces asoensis]GHI58540.1 hypothetical protein Saso_01900 [Streptomyces asoensis]